MKRAPLIVDGQLFQTSAWDRGMGKYSLNLLASLAKIQSDITVIMSSNLERDENKENIIKKKLGSPEIVYLDLSARTDVLTGKNHSKKVLDRYISQKNLYEFNFLILSVFTFDYVAVFPERGTHSLIMYDLIPLTNWNVFSKYFSPSLYFEQFNVLYGADKLFCISKSVAETTHELLSIPNDNLVNVQGAFIPRERSGEIDEEVLKISKKRYALFPSADLPHKNNERTVKAFERFNREFGGQFSLVITSHFSSESILYLESLSPDLVFTGSVSDSEFQLLLDNCEFVVFTSMEEGLGLPILEAVQENIPVVASSINVHKEISSKAFYFADPMNENDIQNAMKTSILREDWDKNEKLYERIISSYTWAISAKKLSDALLINKIGEARKSPEEMVVFCDIANDHDLVLKLASQIKKLSITHNVTIALTSDSTGSPFFLPYVLRTITAREATIVKSKKKYHIISNSENPYALGLAIVTQGDIIINTSFEESIRNMMAEGYFSESKEKTIDSKDIAKDLVSQLKDANRRIITTSHEDSEKYDIEYVKFEEILI